MATPGQGAFPLASTWASVNRNGTLAEFGRQTWPGGNQDGETALLVWMFGTVTGGGGGGLVHPVLSDEVIQAAVFGGRVVR